MPTTISPGRTETLASIRQQLHDLSNVLTGLSFAAGLLRQGVSEQRYAIAITTLADEASGLVRAVRVEVHRLQGMGEGESTNVCDVRPRLGQESGED